MSQIPLAINDDADDWSPQPGKKIVAIVVFLDAAPQE